MTGTPRAAGPAAALRELLSREGRRAPPLPVAVGAVAIVAWWTSAEGGFAPGVWYPGALLFLVALCAVARPADLRRLAPRARWALVMLAAFTAWSFLSIAWADAPGDAWDGANRTLLYLTVFALFAVLPWRTAEAAMFLAGFALAAAGVGAWELVRAIAERDPAAFPGGRLAVPIDYENASAGLFLVAFWPALLLAARRETPWPARGVLLAAASVLLQLCVLAQSRGSLIAGASALALAVALTRDRVRLGVALAAVAVPAAASLPALLAVYEDGPEPGQGVLARAGIAIALSAAVALAAGYASGSLERRWAGRAPRARPSLRQVAAAGAAALAFAGLALALALPDAVPGAARGPALESRFTAGVESGRYDFWRVAGRQLQRNPLHGAGADNFAQDYVRERRRREEPLYPHSFILRAFGQTGVVGAALLVGFLVVACLAAARRGREPVAVAALVCAVAWLAHASIDWLWELPALGVPAIACLGLVAGPGTTAGAPPGPAARSGGLGRLAALGLAAIAAVSYALPALAAREIERAAGRSHSDAAAALRGLDRARRLNPLSDRADVVSGTLALQAGDRARAGRSFRRALTRAPRNWYPEAMLGLLELREGRRGAALARLHRARDLNPLEPALAAAFSAAQRGIPAPAGVEERLSMLAIQGPLGRRPVSCRPVLGLAAECTRRAGA
jgi:O-Antigen ligase